MAGFNSDAFVPHRGLDERIQQLPINNGYVYFATDTNKLYFDADDARHPVGGEGISFVYGDAIESEEIEFDSNSETYLFPRGEDKILAKHYLVDDIIINSDGTFYRILEILETHCKCSKLLVAGTGTGDGGGTVNRWLEPVMNQSLGYAGLPSTYPYDKDIVGTFKVLKSSGGQSANIKITIKDSSESLAEREGATQRFSVAVGENFTVTLPKKYLKPGAQNYVLIEAEVNTLHSVPYTLTINCADLLYAPDITQWKPSERKDPDVTGIAFPYVITSQSGMPDKLDVKVVYTLDNLDKLEFTVTQESGEHDLIELFKNASQGGHTLHVYATTVVAGLVVPIGEYTYGIGWFTGDLTKPIIWSPYNKTEEKNYDTILIEYMVYDPARDAEKLADVVLYVNGEVDKELTVRYDGVNMETWKISTYIPETTNTFTIQCKETFKSFEVYIVRNTALNLEAVETGCELYLTAKGRSNQEKPVQRNSWKNRAKAASNKLNIGEPVLSGFNWYNNGWIDDALRISNGAKVQIPMNAMDNKDGDVRTYEFDFKVNNATDFSKLINVIDTGRRDEDDRPILEYRVASDNAFIKYYYNDKGFMIGTQEAFFAVGETDLVNIKYADGERIKLSFVVDPIGALGTVYKEDGSINADLKRTLVYAYINGVLSGVLSFEDVDFNATNNQSYIEINSDYCDVDIYNIRAYSEALSYGNITQNWVGDAPSLPDRQWRYAINQGLLQQGEISYNKVLNLKQTLLEQGFDEAQINKVLIPAMVITTYYDDGTTEGTDNMLPYQKGDKKCVGVRYFDPLNANKCWHCQNVELDVQGTSSQGYPRRNYKLKTKEKIANYAAHPFKFEKWDGLETNKDVYTGKDEDKMSDFDLGYGMHETTFCLKADYMESSSTHNTGLANLIDVISVEQDGYDFRHPLVKDFDLPDSGYRTTIFGFPILLFHEDLVAKTITYVGKYNFNIDKGATDSFGFSDGAVNRNSKIEEHYKWVKTKPADQDILINDKNKKWLVIDTEQRQGTFEELSECWEFTQNQAGLGKFQGAQDAIYGLDKDNKLDIFNHFEARYHIADFSDGDDVYKAHPGDVAGANKILRPMLNNFGTMWNWVASTNVLDAKGASFPAGSPSEYYYQTLSEEYEEDITYYKEPGQVQTINIVPHATYEELDGEPEESYKNIEINSDALFHQIQTIYGKTDLLELMGIYSFEKHPETAQWGHEGPDGTFHPASNFGIEIPSDPYTEDDAKQKTYRTQFSINLGKRADGFQLDLLERFTADTGRYRLAKFKNEFQEHFDFDYCLMYFIVTELLLLYDSRQKNMMIASYGPRTEGGHYIWYPIFYDMDTQLGVNNSGQVYWDYDADATPLVFKEGSKEQLIDSIFSGNGSVLWHNFALCFKTPIQQAYRALRVSAITERNLKIYYNEKGSDKWTEAMKNIDADYKYLRPATKGFVNQEGKWDMTAKYYYCLQGDRKLNRNAFFRNRLNYMDSQWLGGVYTPDKTSGTQIKIRYNANDKLKTSDTDDGSTSAVALNTNATFTIKPYLSQYLSVLFDETATTPQKYMAGQEDPVVVNPPESIGSQIDAGYALSQQLIYIRGPQYIQDLGDLSLKYMNEFDCTPATRLRKLQVGNPHKDYRNTLLESKDFELDSAEGSPNAKALLQYLDISNLSELKSALNIGGCIKLKTLKALGTNIPAVQLPKGNLLETVYLPATVTNLKLIVPLVLSNVITDRSFIGTTQEPKGLYIDNLTDKMKDGVHKDSYTAIESIEIEEDSLGLDSYRMLHYLYDVKKANHENRFADEAESLNRTEMTTMNKKSLRIRLTGVDWSPFAAVPAESKYNAGADYWYKAYGLTYKQYDKTSHTDEKWNRYVLDGEMFIRDAKYADNPITSLEMFDYFINSKIRDPYNEYYFKSTVDSTLKDENGDPVKVMPDIRGRVHLYNTAETPLEESLLLSKYAEYFPELEITAEHYEPAYRVQYIEYQEDGSKKVLGYQRSLTDTVAEYTGKVPTRLHYDFAGWVLDDGIKYRSTGSIIDDTFEGIIYSDEGKPLSDGTLTTKLSTLKLSTADREKGYVLVAVYKVHGYKMYFYNGNELVDDDPIIVPANTKVVATDTIPYRDDTNLPLYQCNRFVGWSKTDGGEAIDITKITANEDMSFYAVFEVANVYDNPLTVDHLNYVLKSNGSVAVGIKPELKLKGKICIPKSITTPDKVAHDVVSIASASLDGTLSNGLMDNRDLYAVFFEGTQDNTAVITSIEADAFQSCTNLIHVDFPPSLQTIGSSAFADCSKLVFSDLTHVRDFAGAALIRAGSKATQPAPLRVSPQAIMSNNVFDGTSHEIVEYGSFTDPLTVEAMHNVSNGVFGNSDSGTYYALKKVKVYYAEGGVSSTAVEAHIQEMILRYDDLATKPEIELNAVK